MPLERLRSPFHLDSHSPPPTCTPVSSRTRSKAPSPSSRRRRLHAFDELPWISTMDAAPEFLNPWDIADLSLIPDSSLSDPLSSTGPGPVRRRKTSLRSSPISTTTKNHSPGPSPPRDSFIHPSQPVSTPRSRFIPSRVLFHNLMPVVDFRQEHPHSCITTSRVNF